MEHLDTAFAALADPTRRAILAHLAQGETMITELGRPFAMSQPAISRHVKVLEQAGLIRRRTVGTKRLCSLQAPALSELEQWLSMLRRSLETNYQRLDALLAELESVSPSMQREPSSPRTPSTHVMSPRSPKRRKKNDDS
jgi:DNA-binding transcriptional ArsR family regulator